MRTFKIHFCGNFQICDTVLLAIVTMLYIISPELNQLALLICFVVYVFFPPLVGKVLVLQFVNFMTSSIFKFVL